jgi:hypothetical protein
MVKKVALILGIWLCMIPEPADAAGFQLEGEIIIPEEAGAQYFGLQVPFIRQLHINYWGTGQVFASTDNTGNSSYYDFEGDGVPEILSVQTLYPYATNIKIYDGSTLKLKYTVVIDSAMINRTEDGSCVAFIDVDGDGARELAGEFQFRTSTDPLNSSTCNRLLFIDVRTGRIKYSLQGYRSPQYPDGYEGYAFYDIDNDSYPEVLCRWYDSTLQKLRIYGNKNTLVKQPVPGLAKQIAPTIFNSPNPFSGSTKIEYYVTNKEDDVVLDIFDLEGRTVRTLVNQKQKMGEYNLVWDGKGENGRRLAAGDYYFRLKVGGFVSTKKTISLK